MADDLTTRSPGAATSSVSASAEANKRPASDARLESLRSAFRARYGQSLSDNDLQAILARRESRLAHQEKLQETKKEYEATQSREGRAQKLVEGARTERALGTAQAREASGLTGEQRARVGNLEAGPVLPGAQSAPVSAERAHALLGQMLSHLAVGGMVLPPEVYAQALRSRPPTEIPTPPRNAATANASAARAQTPRPAAASPTPRPSAGQPSGRRPAPLAGEPSRSGGALGGAPNAPALGLRPGARAAAATSLLPNAGGGLLNTFSSFDGMRFNFDAFFTNFMMRFASDSHEARRALKELQAMLGELSQQGMQLEYTLTKHRQWTERWETMSAFARSLTSIPKAVARDEVDKLVSNKLLGMQPEQIRTLRNNQRGLISDLAQRLPESERGALAGRTFLSPSELRSLPLADQQRYQNALNELTRQLGTAGTLALMQQDEELLQQGAASDPARARLLTDYQGMLNGRRTALREQVRMSTQHEVRDAMLSDQSRRLAGRSMAREGESADQAELGRLTRDTSLLLREAIAEADRGDGKLAARARVHAPAGDAQRQRADAALREQLRMGSAPLRGLDRAVTLDPARRDELLLAAGHAHLATLTAPQGGAAGALNLDVPVGEAGGQTLRQALAELDAQAPSGSPRPSAELLRAGAMMAGNVMMEERSSALFDLARDDALDRAASLLPGAISQVHATANQNATKAAQGLASGANRSSRQVNAKMSELMMSSQGMLNQLAQLLGMARSR